MENNKEDIIWLGDGIWRMINTPMIIATCTEEDLIKWYTLPYKRRKKNGKK